MKANKMILVLIVCTLFTGSLFPIAHLKIGHENAGFTFSYDGNERWERLSGFRIGVGFTSLYERKFVFQPELYFVGKGVSTSGTFLENPINEKIDLRYLELPMLFRFSILSRSKTNIGLFFGPYASVLLSASQVTTLDDDSRSEDIKKDFKKTDFGTVLGLELVIIKNKFNYLIDIRLTSGMTNIRENIAYNESIKTRSFTISAGIGF